MTTTTGDSTGLHRVLDEVTVLPQAAQRLDARRELWADEVRVRVERLNLDAASYRQLERKHTVGNGSVDGQAIRAEVLAIVATRGKMQNPETGSGGMLVGTVEEVGPESTLGLEVGQRIATLVSLSLTPLVIEDGLAGWDGLGEQVPADGYGDPVRPVHRRRAARRSSGAVEPERHGRVRSTRADPSGGRAVRRAGGRRRRRGREVRLAEPGRRS